MRKCITLAIGLFALSAVILAAPVRGDLIQATSFPDALGSTTMTIAYDGTYYWSSTGGSAGEIREAQYDSSGNLIATYAPGLDFRSIFTNAAGQVFARAYSDPRIYIQTSPGVFTPYATLSGGSLHDQSSVVLNGAGTEYIAMLVGSVSRWDLGGNFLGSTILSGYGSGDGETSYPQNRGIGAAGNSYFTYSNGVMSTWDLAGNRIATDNLIGAGTSFSSFFSFSYTRGMPFVIDDAGGTWRGFSVDGNIPSGAVPEPSSLAMLGIGALGAASLIRRKRFSA